MGASDVSANVEDISSYTIGSTGTISVSTFTRFYNLAEDQTTRDDPGWSTEELYEAQALLVCHYIARRQGMSGKVSESGIGRYGYSRGSGAGLTSWMDEYQALLKRGQDGGSITAETLLGDSGHGYDHYDVTESKKFRLDQEPDKGQVTEDTDSTTSYFYGGD